MRFCFILWNRSEFLRGYNSWLRNDNELRTRLGWWNPYLTIHGHGSKNFWHQFQAYNFGKNFDPSKESVDNIILDQKPISEDTVAKNGKLEEIKFNVDEKSKENIQKAIQYHTNRMDQIHTELLPLGNAPVLENSAFYPDDYDFPERVRLFHYLKPRLIIN